MRIGVKLREAARKYGPAVAYQTLREGFAARKLRREDISLREMAQSFIGDNWHDVLDAQRRAGFVLRESSSAEAVDASAFASITGQLLIDTVREKYELATQVTDQIFQTVPITNGNLGTQREPWLGRVIHDPQPVNQGMPYPTTRFAPQFVDYPQPEKYGEICNVTMEMIFSDLTGQAIQSAESVGEMTGLWVEYKRLAVFLGLVNPHSWNGTQYNTYLTSGAWVNKLIDFTLVDYRSINRVEQLYANMMDPVTGKPIEVRVKDLFVMPTQRYTAKRILNATVTRTGNQATDTGVQIEAANPLDTDYTLITSKHARNLCINGGGQIPAGSFTAAQADTITLFGDFKKAFRWRQVYPLKLTQAPPQNPLEFNQDIVLSVKSSVFGVAAVTDPRFVGLFYNAAAT